MLKKCASGVSSAFGRRLRRFGRGDAGFTLTELVIAMVVLGVISSIAIPSFLGSRNNAYDKEAQTSIEVVLRASKLLYQSQGDFSDASSAQCGDSAILAADLQKLEPNVDVVASSVSSTNSRVVSVQAVQTWSSNAELLGCQGFYAVAFSSSGSCWVGRFISEGKFLASGSASPVVVNAQLNTANSAITTWSALAVNGNTFGVLKPQTSAADGDNTNSLAAIQTACKAKTQSTGAASLSTNYVAPSQFYSSWRDTVAAPTVPPPTCAQGGTCVLGDTGPGGGIVFYVQAAGGTFSCGANLASTCKYLEAAPLASYTKRSWATDVNGNRTTLVVGADATAIGSGYQNSVDIVAQTGNVAASSAAVYAREYTNGGKSDWYLPSSDELNQLFLEKSRIAGLGTEGHWSSSESGADSAIVQYFGGGNTANGNKASSDNGWVRPIRAFG